MKTKTKPHYYIIIACIYILAGCSSAPKITYNEYGKKSYIVTHDNKIGYRKITELVFNGASAELYFLDSKINDTIESMGNMTMDYNMSKFPFARKELNGYLIKNNNDTVIAFNPYVYDIYESDYISNGNKIIVPKSKADDAWSRTLVFIQKNSEMRVQVASDNLIETYNPPEEKYAPRKCGYIATRYSLGEHSIIEISTKGMCIQKEKDAHKFIKFGK